MYDLLILMIGILIGVIISTIFYNYSFKKIDNYYNIFKKQIIKLSSNFIKENYGVDALKEYHRYIIEKNNGGISND